MEPNYLKRKELAYEVNIRGVAEAPDVDSNRKILRALLHRESNNRSFNEIFNPYDFDVDVAEIRESLEDISELVSGLDRQSTSLIKRLETRLSHLSRRINRLNQIEDNEAIIKSQLLAEILILEGDFASKIQPPADLELPMATSSPFRSASFQFPTVQPSSAKVFKWGISFSGSEKPDQVFEFLDRIEELRIARGATKSDLFNSAIDIFKQNALLWFRSIKSTITTWDELLGLLKQEFLPSRLDFDIWEKIRSRKQNFTEKCSVYIASMEALFSRLQSVPEGSIRLEYITNNLHPYYLERLALVDVTSILHLSTLCKKLEDMKVRMSATNKVSNSRPTSSGLYMVTCWNCHSNDHSFPECSAPRKIFCYGCGKQNVKINFCPDCRQKNAKQAVSLATASTSARPEAKGKVTAGVYFPKRSAPK